MDKLNEELESISEGFIPFKKNGNLELGDLVEELNRYAPEHPDMRVEIEYDPSRGLYHFELYQESNRD